MVMANGAGNSGYVKFWRSLLDHPLWVEGEFDKGKAFWDLVAMANWRDEQVFIGKHCFDVQRGQVCMSIVDMTRRWKWSRNRVYRFLTELEKLGMAEHRNATVTSLITITNYESYQSDDTPLTNDTPQPPKTEHHQSEKRNTTGDVDSQDFKLESEGATEHHKGKKRNTTTPKNDTPPMTIEKNKKKNTYSSLFENFWKIYPARNGRKEGKMKAWVSWQKEGCEQIADEIIEKAMLYSRTPEWKQDNGRWVPMAQTFINQHRWEDEFVVPKEEKKLSMAEIAVLMRLIREDYPDHQDRLQQYVDGELPIPTTIINHIKEELSE